MRRPYRRNRIGVIILCIIVVIALVLSYVMMFPLNASAGTVPETPPPPDYGNSEDEYDDSTIFFPDYEDEEEDDKPVPTIKIIGGPFRLEVRQEIRIQCEMKDFPAGTAPEWGTSNSKVAVISVDGRLLAIAPGNVEVWVVAGEKRASVLVTVNELTATRAVIIVDDKVTKTGSNSYEVSVGDVIRFSPAIEPEGAKVDKISWVLGNDKVASITQNGRDVEFVADAVGQTTVKVIAGKLEAEITINIVESGVSLATIWDYIFYGVILVVVIIAIAVILTIMSQRRKKEREARQRAAYAKRRKEEQERRAREEAAAQEAPAPRPAQSGERATMKVDGAAVGAGIDALAPKKTELERPLTLDDLE